MGKAFAVLVLVFFVLSPVVKVNAAWNENGTWIDDVTGQQALNCWIQDGESIYFVKSDGHILTSSWLYDSSGKWYFVLDDGTLAQFLFVRIPQMEQYYDILTGQFILYQNVAGWYYFDTTGQCTDYPTNIEGNVPLYEIKEPVVEEENNTEEENDFEAQKYSNEELEMVARNYLPSYVTYAKLDYIMPILGGCYVYFSTEYGEIEILTCCCCCC